MTEEKKPIWLVWTQHQSGLVTLRLIATTQSYANERRKLLQHDEGVIRAWVGKTITNHLFAEGFFEQGSYDQVITAPIHRRRGDDGHDAE